MSELSPAAQAVLDAWEEKLSPDVTCLTHDPEREALAAALRAAADEVCLRWAERQHPADVLNNIADELDPQ